MPIAEANGIELCYETFGDAEARPLLLVMGLACQMIYWPDDFCTALADAGHFVIRFDNRDVGQSTRFDQAGVPKVVRCALRAQLGMAVDAPYTLDDLADDAVGLLDALSIDRAHVCGVSMGGMIAQTMAIRSPARVASLISIMSNTGHRWRGQPSIRAGLVLLRQRGHTRDEFLARQDALWRFLSSPGYPYPADIIDARSRRAWERGVSGAGVARQLAAIIASPDRTQALRDLDVPTLVVHGADDPLIPVRGGRDTAAAIPGATLRILPGMGHDLPRPLWPELVDLIREHTRECRRGEGRGG